MARFFRFVLNPQSPFRQPDGTVTVRMHFKLPGTMIFAKFVDGSWISVDDTEMGTWGAVVDTLADAEFDPLKPYKMFQEAVPSFDTSSVPLFAAQLVPYDPSPQAQPVVWPAVAAVQAPA